MGRPATPIRFVEFENGCMVALSHKLDQDGYFRKMWQNKTDGWLRMMMHRAIWEMKFGKIPEGHEINHKCKNRACCNTEHLEVLDRNTHLFQTNKERYEPRNDKAKEYWLATGADGYELSEKFGVARGTGHTWIREWKK